MSKDYEVTLRQAMAVLRDVINRSLAPGSVRNDLVRCSEDLFEQIDAAVARADKAERAHELTIAALMQERGIVPTWGHSPEPTVAELLTALGDARVEMSTLQKERRETALQKLNALPAFDETLLMATSLEAESDVVVWCPQCGPEPQCDEDGCCRACGATVGEVPDWRAWKERAERARVLIRESLLAVLDTGVTREEIYLALADEPPVEGDEPPEPPLTAEETSALMGSEPAPTPAVVRAVLGMLGMDQDEPPAEKKE